MSDVQGHVVIVGGGVIGASSAYYLAKSGRQVTIIDAGEFGRQCSHANCGLVCPSHVLPLPEPGAVGKTLRSLFQRNAPFRIKPRWDPGLWAWFWKFARRCKKHHMLAAGQSRAELLLSSMALYQELMESELTDCEWETVGSLYVYQNEEALAKYAKTDQLLREEFDVGARQLGSDELQAMEPSLKPGLAGAWFYEQDAHLRPDRLMSAWRRCLTDLGVEIVDHCEVTGFAREAGRAVAVETSTGPIAAETFLVAVGAWTPWLNRQLQCKVPIQPGKGYSITMPRPADCPTRPLLFPEHKVVVTPMQSGYRLGSTMEFAGYDTRIHPRRLQALQQGANVYLQQPADGPVEEQWYGWRPMTYDGLPIIDRTPSTENILVAAGHNMLGVSMAPATGKLVAEMINGQPPHISPEPFSLSRF